jgi:hypothetical protein
MMLVAAKNILKPVGAIGYTSAHGTPNELRRNPPLRRRHGEEMPLAGHALELVSAAILELKP